jgi:hypothetical protein
MLPASRRGAHGRAPDAGREGAVMARAPIRSYGLVGLAVLFGVGPLGAAERVAGTVSSLAGSATVARASLAKPANLATRDDLFLRDRITTGKESLIRVLLGGRTTVTARELSVLTITDTADRARVGLDAGGAALDVAPVRTASGRPVEVRTPNAIAAVRGTVLTVEVLRISGRKPASFEFVTTVSVFVGAVDVMASRVASPRRVRVSAGQSVVVTGDIVGPVRPLDAVTARRLVADFGLAGRDGRPLPGATARTDPPGGVAGIGIAGTGSTGSLPSSGVPAGRAVGSGAAGASSPSAGAPAATTLAPVASGTMMTPAPGSSGLATSTALPGSPAPPSGTSAVGSSTAGVGSGTSTPPSSGAPSGGVPSGSGAASTASTGGSTPTSTPGAATPGTTSAPAAGTPLTPAVTPAAAPPTPGVTPVATAPDPPGVPAGVLPGPQPTPGQSQGAGAGFSGHGQGNNQGLYTPQPSHQIIKGLNPGNTGTPIK